MAFKPAMFTGSASAARDIRISNQFLITRALHFAQLRLRPLNYTLQPNVIYSDACLIIRLWLCKMESTSNQKLVANSNIAGGLRHRRVL